MTLTAKGLGELLGYALSRNSSADFEHYADKLPRRVDDKSTEISFARTLLNTGAVATLLGTFCLYQFEGRHEAEYAVLTMTGIACLGVGGKKLYDVTVNVQKLWNKQIQERIASVN